MWLDDSAFFERICAHLDLDLVNNIVFSRRDPLKAFNQLLTAEFDIPKGVATTPFRLFELVEVMMFTLENTAQSVQWLSAS